MLVLTRQLSSLKVFGILGLVYCVGGAGGFNLFISAITVMIILARNKNSQFSISTNVFLKIIFIINERLYLLFCFLKGNRFHRLSSHTSFVFKIKIRILCIFTNKINYV